MPSNPCKIGFEGIFVLESTIKIDESDVNKKLKRLKNVKNGAPKAMMRALNRTVTGMKTDAGKVVAQQYIVKQKDVKEKLVTQKANISDLSIALRSNGRPMSLIKFKTRARKNGKGSKEYAGRSFRRAKRSRERGEDVGRRKKIRGGSGGWNKGLSPSVFAQTKKDSSGGYIRGFIAANTTNQLKAVWQRTGESKRPVEKGRYKGQRKEPVNRRHGPGVVQMLSNKKSSEEIQSHGNLVSSCI